MSEQDRFWTGKHPSCTGTGEVAFDLQPEASNPEPFAPPSSPALLGRDRQANPEATFQLDIKDKKKLVKTGIAEEFVGRSRSLWCVVTTKRPSRGLLVKLPEGDYLSPIKEFAQKPPKSLELSAQAELKFRNDFLFSGYFYEPSAMIPL